MSRTLSVRAPDGGEGDTGLPAADVVLVLGAVTWADTRKRKVFPGDRLAEALFDHPRVRRLLIANPFRSRPIRMARHATGQSFERFPRSPRHSLHEPLRLRRVDPSRVRALERSYEAYDRQLLAAVQRAGLQRARVITINPLVAGFAPLSWADSVTFYAEDDWLVADCFRRWRTGLQEAYRRIAASPVRVAAVSETIVEHIGPTGAHAVVPNGIAAGEWLGARHAPDWFAALPRPRVLYLGTLDDRIDVEGLAAVARRFPKGTVALVGRLADPARLRALLRHPNVRLFEQVPRSEVPGVAAAADVGVVPHVRSPLTATMSPLKLYEYLAAGLPVCATDLPPIRSVDPRIVLVDDGEDFGAGVARALERGPVNESSRRAFVAANTWARRHDQVLGLALAQPTR